MQKPVPILVAHLFPGLLAELLNVLDHLTPEDWQRATPAAGWTVHDVALHLFGGDLNILSGKRDNFHATYVELNNWEELVAFINRHNAEWVTATQRISPRLLVDLLRFTGAQVSAYFSTVDFYAQGDSVSWAGPEPAPVWLDMAREFTERWHHQQHIREAVSQPGACQPEYLAPVLDAFIRALPRTYHAVEAGPGTCVTLTITGSAGGSWSVVREDLGWQLYVGKPAQPQAEVTLPDEVAWRLFTKGLTREQARAHASLLGDQNLAEKMLETVSIIG